MSVIKCKSCRKGFNGRNGNGYMPCACKRVNQSHSVQNGPPIDPSRNLVKMDKKKL